jgi:hypothetical protein
LPIENGDVKKIRAKMCKITGDLEKIGKRYCTNCTVLTLIYCEVCAHLIVRLWYYNNCKNPPIHYIVFAIPHSKNTFS